MTTKKKAAVIHSFPVWLPQTQTWMYNQVRYLPEEIEAHIVCERTENLDQFDLPNIHALENSPSWRQILDLRLRAHGFRHHLGFLVNQAKKIKADIIHSHFGNIGWADMGAAKQAGAKHVVTFYGYDINMLPSEDPIWRQRYIQLFAEADLFLCEGPHMAGCLVELGCPEQKVQVQRLGVDLAQLPFRPKIRSAGETLHVLIAGTFREKKGIPDALDAVGQAVARGADLRVTLIGEASIQQRDIDEKNKIFQMIERHALGGRVDLRGFLSHEKLIAAYYDHHVFLSPSVSAANGDTEGGAPVAIVEAAATGLPVVTTTHCDIPFVLGGMSGGFFAAERDAQSLAEHLLLMYGHPEEGSARALVARKNIEKNHDPCVQGRLLASRYQRLVAEHDA